MLISRLNKAISIGCLNDTSSLDNRRIKILNFISYFTIATAFFFTLFDLYIKQLSLLKFVVSIIAVLVSIASIFLHYKQRVVAARAVYIIFTTSIVAFNANYAFSGYLGEYEYMIVPLLSVLFFDKKLIHYSALVICIVLFYLPNYYLHIYNGGSFGYANAGLVFIAVFSFILFFKNLNQKNEKALKLKNDELEVQFKYIEEQKRIIEQNHKELKRSKQKELELLQLKAIRSQMNPHFIFNSLNSIQALVLRQETERAYDYIVSFSELVRKVLHFSEHDFISLQDELSFLELYLQLEQLRMKDDFYYSVTSKTDSLIMIPSLIIQPFVENAIHHGLLHKQGVKRLEIIFEVTDKYCVCSIKDNGIGRTAAKDIQDRKRETHISFSLDAIQKRLDIFKEQNTIDFEYELIDVFTDKSVPNGTEAVVKFPYKLTDK